MKLRWLITRQLCSLWVSLMILPAVSVAEFMADITPAVHALHERTRRSIEFREQWLENRSARRQAYRDAVRREKARENARETARERGGTI